MRDMIDKYNVTAAKNGCKIVSHCELNTCFLINVVNQHGSYMC